jgi:hypothetical protein
VSIFDPAAFFNSSSDLLEESLFGDVPSVVWSRNFHIEAAVANQDFGFNPNIAIEIAIRVGKDQTVSRVKRLLPVQSLMTMSEIAAITAIGSEVGKMVAALQTPRTLEHDPRIGMVFGPRTIPWPRMPLCDRATEPPNLNPFWLLGEAQKYAQYPSGFSPRPQSAPWERCPLCQVGELVQTGCEDPWSVVWSGGNLGWAHTSCATWLVPRIEL